MTGVGYHEYEYVIETTDFQHKDKQMVTRDAVDEQKQESKETRGLDRENQDSEDVDISCGIWKLRTKALGKCFANLYLFALFVGISSLFAQMVDSIVPVQLKSIEKQFNIDNAKAGLFTSFSKFGLTSTILIAGHFTKKSNIPLIIGVTGLIQGFLLTVPTILQFTNPYKLEKIPLPGNDSANNTHYSPYLCLNQVSSYGNGSENHTLPETNQVAFIVVLMVVTLKGVTDTFHSFFLPDIYMDDNVLEKSRMSILLGIRQLFSNLAIPLGTEISGVLTETPIDLEDTSMEATDSRFVSAWWLAFLIFGLGTIAFAIPILLFPKRLISKAQQKKALEKAMVTFAGGDTTEQTEDTDNTKKDNTLSKHEKPQPVSRLKTEQLDSSNTPRKNSSISIGISGSRRPSLLNPIGEAMVRKLSLSSGILPEPQVAPTDADTKESTLVELLKDFPRALFRLLSMPMYVLLLVDVIIISLPYSGIEMFRNTYMSNEYNIRMSEVSYAAGLSGAIGQISGTLISALLASRVNTREGYVWLIMGSYLTQAGIVSLNMVFGCDNQPVYGATGIIGLPVNATGVCDCSQRKQLISCGSDGYNYLSPCFAGCTSTQGNDFIGCNGLQSNFTAGIVTPGLCPTSCHTNFVIYVCLQGIKYMVDGASTIAKKLLILRIVDAKDRAFAISFFMFAYYVLSIPSANLFGSVIDGTCLVWDGDVCTLYDRDQIRYLLAGIDIGINLSVTTTCVLNLLLFKCENRQRKRKLRQQSLAAAAANISIIVPSSDDIADNSNNHNKNAYEVVRL